MPERRSTLWAGPWRGRSVRPDSRTVTGRFRCRRACSMRYGLEVKRDDPSADASGRAVRSALVMQWAGRSEDSEASQATHPVVA